MVYQDELRFRLNRRLTPVLNAYVGVRGLHTTEVVTGSTTVPNRSYATASAGFEWRFTRTFALLGAYTYNWQKFQFDPLSASGNQVGMSVVYEPKRTDVPSYFGASTRPY
jgi:hypothetical protein